MSGRFKGLSQRQIDARIKEGRGLGSGAEYKPFITTKDVSSLGRSHRLLGSKSRRLHHLLSDLELAIFLLLDWSPHVLDIREQFPLRVEDSARIAEELGINHARYQGVPQVLSSDFLVDFSNAERPVMAFQAKYSIDLEKPGVIERLMLEARYWHEKDIPWSLITEREIPRTVFTNIEWLYPAQVDTDVNDSELLRYYDLFCCEFNAHNERTIIAVAQGIDVAYDMEAGHALYWLKRLLARRYFLFDIGVAYRELRSCDLVAIEYGLASGVERASR